MYYNFLTITSCFNIFYKLLNRKWAIEKVYSIEKIYYMKKIHYIKKIEVDKYNL